MEKSIADFISYASMYSVGLPAVIGLIRFRHLQKGQVAIFILVLLSILTEFGATWVAYEGGYQNLVYYGFTIAEFTLLTYVFSESWASSLRFTWTGALAMLFLLFVVLDMFWLSGIEQFNSYSTSIESLLLIAFALLYFFLTLREMKTRHLEREPLFWISIGVLLYFSSSLFIFLFTNTVNASMRALFIIWSIHGIFRILLNICFSIALWIKPNP